MKEVFIFIFLVAISLAISYWIQAYDFLLGYTIGIFLLLLSAGIIVDMATKEKK